MSEWVTRAKLKQTEKRYKPKSKAKKHNTHRKNKKNHWTRDRKRFETFITHTYKIACEEQKEGDTMWMCALYCCCRCCLFFVSFLFLALWTATSLLLLGFCVSYAWKFVVNSLGTVCVPVCMTMNLIFFFLLQRYFFLNILCINVCFSMVLTSPVLCYASLIYRQYTLYAAL